MLPTTSHRQATSQLEILAAVHVGSFAVIATWFFGGNSEGAKQVLLGWGCLGILLTFAAFLSPKERHMPRWPLGCFWPFIALNFLVLVSCLSPGFLQLDSAGEVLYAPRDISWWHPSAARPHDALIALALFDGMWLSALNVLLLIRHRSTIRGLLMLVGGNALVLAIFGTAQKLSRADGLFFGRVKSPQIYFFASFIYDNHWGAFAVLMCALCLGLVRYYTSKGRGREFTQSPAFAGLIATLFIAATVPLSASRSCSVLIAIVLLAGLADWLPRALAGRRRHSESSSLLLLAALAAISAFAAGTWFIAGDTIKMRLGLTLEQISQMRSQGSIGSRKVLYHDTWLMASDKPVFGWGMASYPYVFTLYNSQAIGKIDHLPVYYHDAHSDWLQSAAEVGLVGTALLVLCAVLPIAALPTGAVRKSPLSVWLLFGCALVVLYSLIEFPFGNRSVVFCWWMCFFCAVHYARLDHVFRTEMGSDPH